MPRTPLLMALAFPLALTACTGTGEEDDAKPEKAPKPAFDTAVETDLDGTFYYLVPESDESMTTTVMSVAKDGEPREVATLESGGFESASVSPDGKYLSWVDYSDGVGELHVLEVDKGDELSMSVGAVDNLCREPVWTGTGHTLLTHADPSTDPGGPAKLTDVEAGESTKVEPINGCHARVADQVADASSLIYVSGDVKAVIVRGEDGDVRQEGRVDGRIITGVVSVAAEAEVFCAATVKPDEPVGDAMRKLECDTIVATETGKPVQLDGDFTTALFPSTGGVVTRTKDGRLRLSDGDDAKLDTVDEPAELAGGHLIGFVS